ncbi:hypothetical protein ABPG72_009060 [Tetrahymena utriculariae]
MQKIQLNQKTKQRKKNKYKFGSIESFKFSGKTYELTTCQTENLELVADYLFKSFEKNNDIWALYQPSQNSVKEIIEHRARWSLASPLSLILVDKHTKEPIICSSNVDLVDYKQMIQSGSHINIKTPQFFKQYGSPFVNGHANQIDWQIEKGHTVWGTYGFAATNNHVKGLTQYIFQKNLEYFYRVGYQQYFWKTNQQQNDKNS